MKVLGKIIPVLIIAMAVALLANCERIVEKPREKIEGMVYVPGGDALIGSGESCELPRRKVRIAPFYIDKYPVTLDEYKKFLDATGRSVEARYENFQKNNPRPDAPVVDVSYQRAVEYARWKGKRLPMEMELEYAGRGSMGFVYPWGNEWDKSRVDVDSKGPHTVGGYPSGASPFGVEDLCGNVFHWTGSVFESPSDEPERAGKVSIVKAGGMPCFPRLNRCSYRTMMTVEKTSPFIGFRCVKPVDEKTDPNKAADAGVRGVLDVSHFDMRESTRQLFSYEIRPSRRLPPSLKKHIKMMPEGIIVADVGSGIGYLSYILARRTGKEGMVYAVDIDRSVLRFTEVYAKSIGLNNIMTVHSKPDDITLAQGSCDEIYLLGTIRAVGPDIRESFVKSCKKALKKGGLLVVVEKKMFEMTPAGLREIKRQGFRLEKDMADFKNSPAEVMVKVYRKPEGG